MALTGNNNKFTIISNAENIPFKFQYSYVPSGNQVLRYLGYGLTVDDAYTEFKTSHTSAFPYNVQVTTAVQVQAKNVGNMFSDTIGVIAMVPLNAPITELVHYVSPFY